MTSKTEIVIKPLTPYLELLLWICIMTAGVFSIFKLVQTWEKIWYFTTATFLLSSILLTRIINGRFKTIIITKDSVFIRSYLRVGALELKRDQIIGYKLSEVYHGQGTTLIVRLFTDNKERIDILRDGYQDYNKIKEQIAQSGISYLGRTELPESKKRLFTWFMTWGLIIIPMTIILITYLLKKL